MKKLFMMLVVTLMLGAGLAVAQDKTSTDTKTTTAKTTSSKTAKTEGPQESQELDEDYYGQEDGQLEVVSRALFPAKSGPSGRFLFLGSIQPQFE